MADETKEIIHQDYADATAAIAAMNDKNLGYEKASYRLIYMDGGTPRYYYPSSYVDSGFIKNQTASPQTAGFSISGNGLIGGNATVGGTLGVTGATTLGGTVRLNNANNLQWLNASATTRNILALNVSNNLEVNGTGDGGINFFVGTGNNGGTVSSAGAWSLPSTLVVSGALTLSTLSSGRIPVVSTAGLITQDNLYWDATNDRLGIGSGASSPASILDATESNSGTTQFRLVNSNSAATGGAYNLISANGASGGDAYTNWNINGVTNWVAGVDNSDGDAFVITPSTTPGGATNGLRISTAGAVTIPGTLGVTGAFTGSSTVTIANNAAYIYSGTGNDEVVLIITASTTAEYGGYIKMYGHEHPSYPGQVVLGFESVAYATVKPYTAGGCLDIQKALLASASTTAAAGGTNWTNETNIDVSGIAYVEITPTADGQTYKFTNPASGQVVMVANTTTYNIYIDMTDGSGTVTQYIIGSTGAIFRYNGTRWRCVSSY